MDARLRPRLGAVTGGVLEPRGIGACLSVGRGALIYRRPPSESDLNLLDTVHTHFKKTPQDCGVRGARQSLLHEPDMMAAA